MITRLYVHNFRCLENFELILKERSSTLLVGGNGSGKSTVRFALELLQKIARGTSRVKELVSPHDFTMGRSDVPMSFQIDVLLAGKNYSYRLDFEFPDGFKELRVREEALLVDGVPVFTRALAKVTLGSTNAEFQFDWHSVALPILNGQQPAKIIQNWLSKMLLLAPVPSLLGGDAIGDTLFPTMSVDNFAEWLAGLMNNSPAAYYEVDRLLKVVMPDFKEFKNLPVGGDAKRLVVRFQDGEATTLIPFSALSDGEKSFFVWATAIAAASSGGPMFCFWDEPENHLAPSEVGHFTMDLRRTFRDGSQILMASDSPETIRQFAREDVVLLHRRNHMSPTIVRPISDIEVHGDLPDALIRGDVEP